MGTTCMETLGASSAIGVTEPELLHQAQFDTRWAAPRAVKR